MHVADATNALAEAPPPIALLHVTIDEKHRNWNNNDRRLNQVPKGHVLPVLKALQGHRESPVSGMNTSSLTHP